MHIHTYTHMQYTHMHRRVCVSLTQLPVSLGSAGEQRGATFLCASFPSPPLPSSTLNLSSSSPFHSSSFSPPLSNFSLCLSVCHTHTHTNIQIQVF